MRVLIQKKGLLEGPEIQGYFIRHGYDPFLFRIGGPHPTEDSSQLRELHEKIPTGFPADDL